MRAPAIPVIVCTHREGRGCASAQRFCTIAVRMLHVAGCEPRVRYATVRVWVGLLNCRGAHCATAVENIARCLVWVRLSKWLSGTGEVSKMFEMFEMGVDDEDCYVEC